MLNHYTEKNAVAADMLSAESVVSRAYKTGIASRRIVGRLFKQLQSRRNVVAKIAPSKYKGNHSAYTIECAINDGRITFDAHCFMFSQQSGGILSNNIPFTIANHALARYFERTTEHDFLLEYRSALAFYCLYSAMHVLGKLDSNDIIIPCESGLLLSSVTGIEQMKFDIFRTTTMKRHSCDTINPATTVIAKTFISHAEMFDNQRTLWEKMMTFYDEHETKVDDMIRMLVSPMDASVSVEEHSKHLMPLFSLLKVFDETVYKDVKKLQDKP